MQYCTYDATEYILEYVRVKIEPGSNSLLPSTLIISTVPAYRRAFELSHRANHADTLLAPTLVLTFGDVR